MIFFIQYVRTMAALMVVISHISWKGEQYSTNPLSFFPFAGVGVALFVLMSGYLLIYIVETKDMGFVHFIKSRVKRIIPLYWFFTTLALIIYLLFPDKVNSSGGVTYILDSYTLLPTEGKYLLGNAWTLKYELFFYLILGISLFFLKEIRYIIVASILSTLVILGIFVDDGQLYLSFITNPLLLEFVLGIMIYHLHKKIKISITLGMILILFAVSLSIYFTHLNLVEHYPKALVGGVPGLLLFIGFLSFESLFEKKNSNKSFSLFKKISVSSYSLYLSQPFSLAFFAIILNKLGINEFGYLYVSLLLVFALFTGYLVHIFIEKRFVKAFQKSR